MSRGAKITLIIVVVLVVYYVANNPGTSNSVVGSMFGTLTRWISDAYHYLTGATNTHP